MLNWFLRRFASKTIPIDPLNPSFDNADVVERTVVTTTGMQDPPKRQPRQELPEGVLYRRRRHVKYFLKKIVWPAVAGLVCLILLVRAASDYTPTLIGVGVPVAGLVACGYLIARQYYGWQRFVLEVNVDEVIQHTPESVPWLFRGGRPKVMSREVVTTLIEPKTPVELVLFLKCRTVTLDTKASEDQAFHNMGDTYHPEELEAAITEITRLS